MANTALFPIQLRVDKLTTQFMDYYPPKKGYKLDEITIPPKVYGWFDDHEIEVPNPPKGKSVEGHIKFQLT